MANSFLVLVKRIIHLFQLSSQLSIRINVPKFVRNRNDDYACFLSGVLFVIGSLGTDISFSIFLMKTRKNL